MVKDMKTPSKDLNKLNELVKVMSKLAIADIKKQGVKPLIVETYRTKKRQKYLYCQGRSVEECMAKGISKSFAKKYCNTKVGKVTWTLNSVHINRKAIDIVPQRRVNGKMTAIWDSKDKQFQIIINTMQKYGFEAGANWKNTPDGAHFQVKGNFGKVFNRTNNTVYVTKVIQKALKAKVDDNLVVDGIWGDKTTDAVNKFLKSIGAKKIAGQINKNAYKKLMK